MRNKRVLRGTVLRLPRRQIGRPWRCCLRPARGMVDPIGYARARRHGDAACQAIASCRRGQLPLPVAGTPPPDARNAGCNRCAGEDEGLVRQHGRQKPISR